MVCNQFFIIAHNGRGYEQWRTVKHYTVSLHKYPIEVLH